MCAHLLKGRGAGRVSSVVLRQFERGFDVDVRGYYEC